MTTTAAATVHHIYSTPAQLTASLRQLSKVWQVGDAVILLAETCLLANEPAFANFTPLYALQTDVDKFNPIDNLADIQLLTDKAWLTLLLSTNKNISWIAD